MTLQRYDATSQKITNETLQRYTLFAIITYTIYPLPFILYQRPGCLPRQGLVINHEHIH